MKRTVYLLSLIFLISTLSPKITLAQKDSSTVQEGKWIHWKKTWKAFFTARKRYNFDDLRYEANEYKLQEGKIIRSIKTKELNFELEFDSSSELMESGKKLMDKIHQKTKAATIQKNLFFSTGDSVNGFLLADNERFMRTLPYIQDAQIKVLPIKNSDSVDLLIISKDLFGYSGMLGGLSLVRQNFGLSNINISGRGQSFGIDYLHDIKRSPSSGFSGFYTIQNMGGKFIDARISAGNTGQNLYNKKEDEFYFLLDFNHPLISQYKRWAGGLSLGSRNSLNLYPDIYKTGTYPYKLGIFDFWMGYNIGAEKYLRQHTLKTKKFVAIRYFNHAFFKAPDKINGEKYDQQLNSALGILASFTLFRQFYYKEHYVYQFGVTEDIPAGFNASIVMGYYQQLDVQRPYIGLNYYNYKVSGKGDLGGFFLRTGSFYADGWEDIGLLTGASIYLRLMKYKRIQIRNYFKVSYSSLSKRKTMDLLRINNSFGLYGFESTLAQGNKRISFRMENYYFQPFQILNFNIAPISIVDLSWLNNSNVLYKSGFFFALGAGVRIKNESLGFNTVEMRASVLPRKLVGDYLFHISFITNLDFKYRSNYVNKPQLIQLNSDEYHHIF